MEVQNKSVSTVFRAISLSRQEKEISDRLVAQLAYAKNKDDIKIKLLDVFDKHIQTEVKQKAKGIFRKDDLLQKMYLNFFDAVENIKELTTGMLVTVLSNTRPEEDEVKEQYRFGVLSLEKPKLHDSKHTIGSYITDADLPVYKSSASEEEREFFYTELQKLAKKSDLTGSEKGILKEKSSGKTFNKIAQDRNRSQKQIMRLFHNSVAKIQDSNGVLPEKFNAFADKLIAKYNLNIDKNKLKNILLNNTYLLNCSLEILSERIDKTSQLLKIRPEEYVSSVIKFPQVFFLKSETVAEHVNKTSRLLDINSDEYISAALSLPPLFVLKPETVAENINKTSELLSISPKIYTKAALKQPSLFARTPETISQNLNKTSELLSINSDNYKKAALKSPSLFYRTPETIAGYVNEISQLLNINSKDYIKAALKFPQLFTLKPQTILNGINKTSQLLRLKPEKFINAALKQPSLFCLKPETIIENTNKGSKMLNITLNEYVDAALKFSPLFYLKPETVVENVNRTSRLLNINPGEYVKAALIHPQLFAIKPENVAKKVKIIQYYKQIQGKEHDEIVFSLSSEQTLYEKILNYMVKTSDGSKNAVNKDELINYLKKSRKIYDFVLPENELKKDFIRFILDFSDRELGKQIFVLH